MNKICFQADKLNIKSNYSTGDYSALLDELNGILCQFENQKCNYEEDDPQRNLLDDARKKAMDSHPELILALYVLYYFGTKAYGWNSQEQYQLRNIKNYEDEIFKFENWQDFLDSISSGEEKYDRKNEYLRNMAEDFFTRLNRKDSVIQTVIDNYKNRGVFSSETINQEKEIKDDALKNLNNQTNKINNQNNNEVQEKDNLRESDEDKKSYEDSVRENPVNKKNEHEININTEQDKTHRNEILTTINYNLYQHRTNTNNETIDINQQNSKTTQKSNSKYNKKKIAMIIITVLIFLLLIVSIISMNPIFIKTMVVVSLIYVVIIILFNLLQKSRFKKRNTEENYI